MTRQGATKEIIKHNIRARLVKPTGEVVVRDGVYYENYFGDGCDAIRFRNTVRFVVPPKGLEWYDIDGVSTCPSARL